MGGINKLSTVNLAHESAMIAAEATRQSAVAAAAQSAAGQLVINTAEIAWARAMVANCNANNGGFGAAPYVTLLRSLGTGGV